MENLKKTILKIIDYNMTYEDEYTKLGVEGAIDLAISKVKFFKELPFNELLLVNINKNNIIKTKLKYKFYLKEDITGIKYLETNLKYKSNGKILHYQSKSKDVSRIVLKIGFKLPHKLSKKEIKLTKESSVMGEDILTISKNNIVVSLIKELFYSAAK